MNDQINKYTWVKDPEAVLIYGIDWSNVLDSDVSIVTSEWSGDDSIVIEDDIIEGNITKALISGGIVRDAAYRIRNTVTLSGSLTQIDKRSLYLFIREK